MQRFLLLAILGACSATQAQPLTLVPSSLVIPPKFQKYYDSAETVYLPSGFSATVFYTGTLSGPRFLALDPNGNVCVADAGANSVVELPDTNNDGVADTAITIATGTNTAESIAFHEGALYAAASTRTYKYTAPDAHGVYGTQELFIQSVDASAQGTDDHTSRTILFDDHSNSVFLSVGSPCDACRELDTMRASVVRYDRNGTNPTLFASGLRNAVGLAMDSSYNLWATVAERNNQGADAPGELLTMIEPGAFYGWPLAYGDHVWDNFSVDSEYQAMLPITHEDSVRVANMRPPEATIAAHSTPLGIAFYHDTTLPASFDNSFFVAVHGSYNGTDGRLIANGSKIILLQNNNGVWTTQDFCTGFLTDSIKYLRWARPCGIILDRHGNIFFSSDHTSPHSTPAVFRVSYDANSVVHPNTIADHISLSPDPTAGTVAISEMLVDVESIIITNLLGEQVLEVTAPHSTSYSLDLTALPQGTYFVRFVMPDGSVMKKIVRE